MASPHGAEAPAGVFAGFVAIWFALDRSAAWLGSTRGESGFIVLALALATALGVERLFFRRPLAAAAKALGFVRPEWRALVAALGISVAMLAFFPAAHLITPVGLVDGWPLLALGMFAQGGIAEEMLFRAFVFGHLRRGRTFLRAAGLAAAPFIAVHLLLLTTLDPPVALTSIALAASMALPFAWLYERAGNSVWPPAILHFVIQASIKLVVVEEAMFGWLALGWIGISAIAPWLVFLLLPANDSQARKAAS